MSEPSEEQKRNYFVLALVIAYIVIALGNHHFRRLLVYKKNKKILEAQIAELDEKNRELELTSVSKELPPGRRKIAVKVVDIFGNDTMKVIEVKI